MKLMVFSDLHLCWHDKYSREEKIKWINSIWDKPDAIVITGDVFESTNYKFEKEFSTYKKLDKIFGSDVPIICTTGNHEYIYMTVDDVLTYYKQTYNPKKYNVHYLDVVGHYDIGNYRFVGNCLWYDGSMKTIPNQDLYDWGDGRWLDRLIREFDYEKECKRCMFEIDSNIDASKINILCTHSVPDERLNLHMDIITKVGFDSPFNAYSGVKSYLNALNGRVKYSFSGHTHKRVTATIDGVECYNCGNDYQPPYSFFTIEV